MEDELSLSGESAYSIIYPETLYTVESIAYRIYVRYVVIS